MIRFRSLLNVPANRPRMVARAPDAGADALILDLEDSVPLTEKAEARGSIAQPPSAPCRRRAMRPGASRSMRVSASGSTWWA